MSHPTHPIVRRMFVGVAVAALAVSALATDAGAGTSPRNELLTITGNGDWTPTTAGGQGTIPVEVLLPNDRHPRDASALVIMSADDGRYPALGSCEPAYAIINVDGDRKTTMGLHVRGEVCGEYAFEPDGPSLQKFTGRYTIVRGPKRVEGGDGFAEIVFAEDGAAHVFAIDT